jgi:hypothetical protein
MGISASDLASTPSTSNENLYSKNNAINKSIVQESIQTQMNTEPIYSTGVDKLQGYMSYKMYDAVTGAAINNGVVGDDSNKDNSFYYLSKDGKRFASGKTYVINSATIAIPPKTEDSSDSDDDS